MAGMTATVTPSCGPPIASTMGNGPEGSPLKTRSTCSNTSPRRVTRAIRRAQRSDFYRSKSCFFSSDVVLVLLFPFKGLAVISAACRASTPYTATCSVDWHGKKQRRQAIPVRLVPALKPLLGNQRQIGLL